MKFWNDLDGAVLLGKVFSTPVPVSVVELSGISIDNDRNNITIGFDIDEIPDVIPEKWLKNKFNTCRIGLDCGEIKNLLMENIPTTSKLKVEIKKADDCYLVIISSNTSAIKFTAKYIFLRGPTVYFNTERL
ncbi:Imm50 family immunity protein [Pseudomonas sp. CCC3.1]|uniref:Imm50 family immunity protein n=1 Tax=Pseudomonas sp. CCC3.1 TaxID=3048607 RepID=UPI002AC8FA0F|nr:Imm50 family immunity protein [Pseudomonas sp. CCC3.1]MEB0207856.1 Imm50 family immunity protein [Pseudomonas sp. CCC3.1]WPX34724.1 Imm50 family immunity protein [Pseudomonas sp. CCC3.1]